jgi:hypothetical protein
MGLASNWVWLVYVVLQAKKFYPAGQRRLSFIELLKRQDFVFLVRIHCVGCY